MSFSNQNNFFALILSPRTMHGYHLIKKSDKPEIVSSFAQTFDNLEFEQLLVYNPTRIGTVIDSWYQAIGKQVPIGIALDGPAIAESITSIDHKANAQELLPTSNYLNATECQFLFTADQKDYYYICTIARSLLFQIMLLSITRSLPIETICSKNGSLLWLYQKLLSSTSNQQQLAQDIAQARHIDQLFDRDDLYRLASINNQAHIHKTNQSSALAACSLFFQEQL